MRKHWLPLAGLLLTLGGTSCGTQEEAPAGAPAPRRTAYFPLRSYLDSQAVLLTRQHPAVVKRVLLRNRQPETTRVPQVDWTNELQVFYQADIDKPALRDAYSIDSTTTTGSGRRYTYVRKPGIKSPVSRLIVESDETGVRDILATLAQDNPLFFSEKKLRLRAQDGVIRAYQVQGVQKLILFDTLRYSAAARTQ